MEILIGAGGWAYFHVEGLNSLAAYAQVFNFVEVNSTFYQIPNLRQVHSWRKRVPPGFEFAVRCFRGLTHNLEFEPLEEAYDILKKMVTICEILNAKVLHLQTSDTFKLTAEKIESIHNLLSSFNFKDITLAWEIRQKSEIPEIAEKLMRDLNITHCVDLSRQDPVYITDILYSRLFGKGVQNIYQFDDKELMTIDRKVSDGDHKKALLSFHGVKMYKDAARLNMYKRTGEFPPVTNSVGLASLEEVLSEDAQFPTAKKDLIQHQGWKVIDITPTQRIHAHQILQKLPHKTYSNVQDVITQLKTQL